MLVTNPSNRSNAGTSFHSFAQSQIGLSPATQSVVRQYCGLGENCARASCSGLLKSISTTGNGAGNVALSAATTLEYCGSGIGAKA